MSSTYCRNCGTQISDNNGDCVKCGVPNGGTPPRSTALVLCGYIFGVIFPVVGIVLGIILLAKKNIKHGTGVLAVCLLMSLVWSGFMGGFLKGVSQGFSASVKSQSQPSEVNELAHGAAAQSHPAPVAESQVPVTISDKQAALIALKAIIARNKNGRWGSADEQCASMISDAQRGGFWSSARGLCVGMASSICDRFPDFQETGYDECKEFNKIYYK